MFSAGSLLPDRVARSHEILDKTGGESWIAMKAALTETRTALDEAHQAVHESLKRVA